MKLITSIFLAFLLSKLTSLNDKLNNGNIDDTDLISLILIPVQYLLEKLHIFEIEPLNIFDFGYGFEGTTHTVNSLISFTPIFFILLITISLILTSLKFIFKRDNSYF